MATYDYRADAERSSVVEVPARAVLVFDGVFLLRAQLRHAWTLSVYLRVSEEEIMRRARARDIAVFGTQEEIERRYRGRYLPGQALYRREADPETAAQIVVDNEHAGTPTIVRWPITAPSLPAAGQG